MTLTTAPSITAADLIRLSAALALVEANDTESVLATAMPSLGAAEREAVVRHATFTHAALMIFVDTLDGLGAELAAHGVEVGPAMPSVVVRDRLSSRYGLPAADLTVGILHATAADRAGRPCQVEIFAMVTPPELAEVAADERRHGRENHFALAIAEPDPVVFDGLRSVIAARMRPDGGGYNDVEDATVLYFRDAHHPDPTFRRLELHCAGHFPGLVDTHRRASAPATGLLELMTGAWATQAIATAAELRLPDHLATTTDLPCLAEATGADGESLGRLLRYLTTLGVVHTAADGYELTDTGALLRSDVDGSMRPLALMYGGPFYRSFAALTDAVRTGDESYAKVFGVHHFAHMAADPGLADLFHRSMGASNPMFSEVTRVVEFAGTVVDVAGGNGELLGRVLRANPDVRGVLLERPHALAAAERLLADVADRCTLVAGDFTESVPAGGDTYLLSRVLHDWDDTRCAAILATCASGMPDHAQLLVVERLLPETCDTDSLAVPWDIHMLCNVGGRERTAAHYRALLSGAGFEITAIHPLPLDAHVLCARRSDGQEYPAPRVVGR
ncbi:methyltransferase [Actinophytocola oryzae]|uniref:O-methyltransferase n=1 Tax=Actinophytocola oryzae TaxID=502181 RepID=A0A4V3FUU6_9PSEU|nr:methyltransferase [Actinophytocola oryzae]TDV56591.1 O-methyltransferase [Actinophytocola oryzae]